MKNKTSAPLKPSYLLTGSSKSDFLNWFGKLLNPAFPKKLLPGLYLKKEKFQRILSGADPQKSTLNPSRGPKNHLGPIVAHQFVISMSKSINPPIFFQFGGIFILEYSTTSKNILILAITRKIRISEKSHE